MEKSTEQKVDDILRVFSESMGVEIKYAQMEEDNGQVRPAYNLQAMISKFTALMVFAGVNMPSVQGPSFNSVHADVEWWKNFFEPKSVVEIKDEPSKSE